MQVIDYFNAGIKEAEAFLCLARSSKLQLAQCVTLDLLSYNAKRIKLSLGLLSPIEYRQSLGIAA